MNFLRASENDFRASTGEPRYFSQGKRKIVQNNGEFEITEFELAGSNCTS